MIDFAGQFAYYACHQIYMRSSAFYILVMDMSKSFEEVVFGEEEEDQKGSVFSTWKYKEYVEFWLNSIKSFGGPEAPVLIVATHTDGRTEDDIDDYFVCLWRSLPEVDKTWLSNHRSEENEYAFELININEGERTQKLQLLKNALVEVVSNKLDTKIPVRSSWALLEHLLRDSGKPIISYEEIQEMNREVPEQYRLESEEEIPNFLTFFHDHGILLYFKGEGTGTHAILSLQWFSDAFSRLIADKKHINRDCKRQHITEWENFNKTGELNSKLVEALWKDEKVDSTNAPSYIEYKTELMSYMERLRMLVSIGEIGKGQSWYVPCMNKKPFTKDIIKAKACSSILCFRYTSFAIFVFYRLVAYCVSSLKWKVVPDKTDRCLFQTAAVFKYKNHTVLLGICDKDIQLQVNALDIRTEVSCEIGRLIDMGLHELTQTFENTNLTFQRGYKCQKIFCDQNDTSFTLVEDLCQLGLENIECSCCPIGENHQINVQETRRFWEQNPKETDSFPTVSQSPLERTDWRERQLGEPFRKDRDDSYPLEHTQIIGKYEIGKRVGRIQLTNGRGVGTGFRVGSKYVMTAYHVMGDKLEKLWREVHGLLTEDERNKIEWTKDKLPVTGSWNIYNLISPLHFKRKAKVEGRAEDLIEKYEIKFEYLNEGAVGRIVKFKPDIAFVSPENDVLVLELAELESEPRFFNLVEYNISEEKIHVFGHPDGIPLQHDPGCTVINNETKLAELKKEGIAFFKKELPDKECEIKDDYALCEISEDKILFHSSSSTAKGASGAPLTIVVNDTIKVYGMLLNGHPKVFYNYFNKKDMKRHELLVESGISMRKIRSLLESCLPEFEQELF